MCRRTAQFTSTWAEDTALQRCTRSAVPGAETEARAVPRSPGFHCFGISTKAQNLRGTTPRHTDRTSPSQLTNADRPEFHFPLNQDTVNNRAASRTRIPSMVCPSDPVGATPPNVAAAPTSYCFSHGPVASWSIANSPGPFSFGSSRRLTDVTDGTSNTIAMAEVKIGSWRTGEKDAKGRNHTAGDLNTATGTFNARVFNINPTNLAAIQTYYQNCASGYQSSPEVGDNAQAGRNWATARNHWGPMFNTLMTPNKGPHCNNAESPTEARLKTATSYHTGGVQVLMLDGSVHFISDSIDHGVWVGAGTIDGAETVSLTQ